MDEKGIEAFYALSCELTGFDRVELDGTGVGNIYVEQVTKNIGPDTVATLFRVWSDIENRCPQGQREREIAERIFDEPELRAAAERIVMLWYTGSWYYVPPFDTQVVSAETYIEGLMWKAIRSHPIAAKAQGYGAWALPPPSAA
ncbi:MAG TPA: hypothetical protein VGC56_10470 [Allosphingosinicella sp.]|jgi:hypothetical protein